MFRARVGLFRNNIILTAKELHRPRGFFTSRVRSSRIIGGNTFKYSVLGLGFGAVVGAGYSFWQPQPKKVSHAYKDKVFPILSTMPPVTVSRKIVVPTDNTGLQLTLFQYPTCPFCCKVRAFLDFFGLSYDVVEVNPVLRQQIKWSQYKKVPVLLAKVGDGYQQLNDSSVIISSLRSFLLDTEQNLQDIVKCYTPVELEDGGKKTPQFFNRYWLMYQGKIPVDQTKEVMRREAQWRGWADEELVHVLSPNVYRTFDEALQAFNWFSKVGEWDILFPAWERNLVIYVGAFAMWIIGKRLKKRHNLKEDVRQSLYDYCRHWLKAVKKQGTIFMGGDNPDLSDLAVYGVLSSIEGCEAFQDLLSHTDIGSWYYKVQDHVQNHSGRSLLH